MANASFSHTVSVNDIPAAGRRFHVEADEEDRRRLTAQLGILEIAKLAADVEVRPTEGRAFTVRGTIDAAVVQTDVVTLEPVAQIVSEEIDMRLVPAERQAAGLKRNADAAVEIDDRDIYRNNRIDLGAIAGEHLAMALDPYPRGEGVEFPPHLEDHSDAANSPFAVLKGLKREKK
jgi:uncharacterized metal-binding protein YceD (DUF177 family)